MNARATVPPLDAAETGKTDKTDIVGNVAFLMAVFGDQLVDARPVVVSFEGDPLSAPSRDWLGKPWDGCRRGNHEACPRAPTIT